MTFFLESDPLHPNPTIEVKAGERVRVKNQDRGMTHDFAVPAINAAVSAINWNQENGITFAVPLTPGTYECVCRSHQL